MGTIVRALLAFFCLFSLSSLAARSFIRVTISFQMVILIEEYLKIE